MTDLRNIVNQINFANLDYKVDGRAFESMMRGAQEMCSQGDCGDYEDEDEDDLWLSMFA